jgi:predicted component of type VI protein secretion system
VNFSGGEMAAQFQLVMHAGPTPGKTFQLEGDVITIGREAGNGIVINDAEVSRKHCQFVLQGGKYILTDLGSTNGTFVNGQRLTGQHILLPGEVISLGEQINLLFETVAVVDPNATMLSSGRSVVGARPAPIPAPAPPAPMPQPAAYAGQVPAGPEPGMAASARGGSRTPLIIAGVVLVLAICCCVGALWYIDANFLWCKISFGLIPGCQ